MKESQSKKVLTELLQAFTTEDVQKIIDAENFNDDNDWKPYGKREKNWDIISNQQSNAVGALTELITNAIDAVLCRKAYEAGITDLTGENAPQSMQEAVRQFYNVNEGKLSSLGSTEQRELAEKSILIGIKRGKKKKKTPTITVVDFGEGQLPAEFPDTFMSLSKNNKEGIGFVQGKFNMGSTGSIRFCSESDKPHYKLIVSKKRNSDSWGWSLIRVPKIKEGKKLPTVEYLAPDDKIPQFKASTIPSFGDKEIGLIAQGSVVRLFDYDIGDGAHGVDFGLYYALNLNLLDCALPIRLYDFDAKLTQGKGKRRAQGIADRTFSGMSVILNAEFADPSNQDPEIPTEAPAKGTTEFVHLVEDDLSNPELGKVRIIATGVSKLPNYMENSRKRVFYTINGQTHATENAGLLNSVKLGDLQNHLIINVQCEEMNRDALTIFMGDRERMINNNLSRELKKLVKDRLKDDSKLKQYAKIIRLRRAKEKIENDEETQKMLNDFIARDPMIKELLGLGTAAIKTIKTPRGTELYEGKKFPTFLNPLNLTTVKEGQNKYFLKEVPVNANRKIKCGTDAADDYLSRTNSPGWVKCSLTSADLPRSASLRNGTATFTVSVPKHKQVGDVIDFEIGFDDHGPRPVPLVPIKIKITPEENPAKSGGTTKSDTKNTEKPQIADPTQWAEKSNWDEYGFDEKSGAKVINSEEGLMVYVNRDHERLEEMRLGNDEAAIKLNENRFRMCLGFLTLAVYRHYDETENPDDADSQAEKSSQAMAPYILSIINVLGGEDGS